MPKRLVRLPNGTIVTGSRRSIIRTAAGYVLRPRIDGTTCQLGIGSLEDMVTAWHVTVDLLAAGIIPTPALITAELHND
jgi:hypothetical protein